jgi:putative ATP-dependent endonuclease of the OLD family
MHIESVIITGFRCYGPVPTVIDLSPGLTGFVGANASGKTAALQALMRLFGVTRALRTVVLSDFHVPPTEIERPKQRVIFTYSPERGQRTKVAPLYELLDKAGVPRIEMA